MKRTILSADASCRMEVDGAVATVQCGERVLPALQLSGEGAMLAVSNCGFFVADVSDQLRQWLNIYVFDSGTWTRVYCQPPSKAIGIVAFAHDGAMPDVVCRLADGSGLRVYYKNGAWHTARTK